MNWTDFIIPFCTLVIGGGGCGWFFFIKETRREKQVKTENEVAEMYRQLAIEKQHRIDSLESTLEKKDEKIEELYRDRSREMEEKYALLEALATERMLRCTKVGCVEREPPFGTLKKLKNFLENEPRIEKQESAEH